MNKLENRELNSEIEFGKFLELLRLEVELSQNWWGKKPEAKELPADCVDKCVDL